LVAVICAEQMIVWPLSTPPGTFPRGVFFAWPDGGAARAQTQKPLEILVVTLYF
jgi:hypothetical protein